MDDTDRAEKGTDYLKYLDPDQQANYEGRGPSIDRGGAAGEGLVEKVREAVGDFLRGEEDGPTDAATGSASEAASGTGPGGAGPGSTDYTTSNYSEDVGRAPSDSDVEDVNKEYR